LPITYELHNELLKISITYELHSELLKLRNTKILITYELHVEGALMDIVYLLRKIFAKYKNTKLKNSNWRTYCPENLCWQFFSASPQPSCPMRNQFWHWCQWKSIDV